MVPTTIGNTQQTDDGAASGGGAQLAAQLEAQATITPSSGSGGGGGASAHVAGGGPPPTAAVTALTDFERKTLTIDGEPVDYRPGLEWAHLEDPAAMKESGFCTDGHCVDAAVHPHWAGVRKAFIEEMPTLRKKAFDKPTAIQCTALPRLLATPGSVGAGADMIMQAPTGTGKTGAFVGAALCVVDTSELAVQVLMLAPTGHVADIHHNTARALGKYIGNLEVRAYYGCATANGKGCRCAPGSAEQPHSSRRGTAPPCHVLTGTAGKLVNVARSMDLSKIKVVVVDEADALFSDTKRSDETKKEAHNTDTLCAKIRAANPACRFILASATAPRRVRAFYATRFPRACTIYQEADCTLPDTILVATKALPAASAAGKSRWVAEWCTNGERAIVFAPTRAEVHAVHAQFVEMGVHAGAIHGGMNRAAQDMALEDFKAARTCVLVSSSVIERGVDLDGVTHVVLYQTPMKGRRPDYTAFVQKIGRCGRSENRGVGVVITSTPEDEANLALIAQHFSIDLVHLVGDDADDDADQLAE